MSDNTVLSVGAGGDTVRDKDRAGIKTQIVGLDLNIGGTETLMAGAMPVTGTFWQATQPISGTVTANAGTNLNTSLLALEAGHLATIDTKTPALGQALAGASTPVVLPAAQITALTPLSTVAVTGTFWQATQPVSVAATVHVDDAAGSLTVDNTGTFAVQVSSALPAGTNLLGQTSASNETGTVYSGTTALVPKFAVFNLSATGTVVAGVGGKRIRVLRWRVSANGTVNIKWQGHAGPTDISGLSYCVAGKDCGGGYCPVGHFQTVASEALDLNLSAGVSVSGELTYVEV